MQNMPEVQRNVFDRSVWLPDRMVLDDLVFRLEHYKADVWDGGEHFLFFKVKGLVDQYDRWLRSIPHFAPKRILELGIFDGGSTAFWHEIFRPARHVALDSLDRQDSPYFRRYLDQRGLAYRIVTHWGTNQADKERLRAILRSDFDGPVDLVIDDASHLYGPTLATFETVFPLLRPGALYLIEDWAWGHWPESNNPDHPWAAETPLTQLVFQLVEAAGTSTGLISNLAIYSGFVAIERGTEKVERPVPSRCHSRYPEAGRRRPRRESAYAASPAAF